MRLSKETMAELGKTVKEAFVKSSDARFVRRLDILTLVFAGNEIQNVAKIYRISRSTISNWIARLRKEGIKGLKDKPGKGMKQVLSNSQKQALKKDLEKSPLDFEYKQSRWDGKLLVHHLKMNYGIEFKVRKCQYLFHELGFSPEKTSIHT